MILENGFLAGLLVLTDLFLVLSFYKLKKVFKFFFGLLFIVLLTAQIKTTQFWNEYKLLPVELDRQIQRMNQFPPSLAKLGYILEAKSEIQILNKLQNNFFSVFDLNFYFPNYFPFITSPLLFYGLFIFLRKKNKTLILFFVSSVLFLIILGVHGKYGPFLIFPFFVLFIIISLGNLLNRLRKNEIKIN